MLKDHLQQMIFITFIYTISNFIHLKKTFPGSQMQKTQLYNSRQKENTQKNKKKIIFNHGLVKNIHRSKQKMYFSPKNKNQDSNPRKRRQSSPQKNIQSKRSPSKKQSQNSKDSAFSKKDRKYTQRIEIKLKNDQNFKNQRKNYVNAQKQNRQSLQGKLKSASQKSLHNNNFKLHIGSLKRLSDQNMVKKDQKFIRRPPKQKVNRHQKHNRHQKVTKKKPIMFEKIDRLGLSPRNIEKCVFGGKNQVFLKVSDRKNAQHSQAQQIQQLQQQNNFYKLIYKASMQKLKRLRDSIEKEKQSHKQTKQSLEKQLKSLKVQIDKRHVQKIDKKNLPCIGHLYSYDDKNPEDKLKTLKTSDIIVQTENQESSIVVKSRIIDKNSKQYAPSKLSIDST